MYTIKILMMVFPSGGADGVCLSLLIALLSVIMEKTIIRQNDKLQQEKYIRNTTHTDPVIVR